MGLKVKMNNSKVQDELNEKLSEFGLFFDMPTDDEIKESLEKKKKEPKKEEKKETKNK